MKRSNFPLMLGGCDLLSDPKKEDAIPIISPSSMETIGSGSSLTSTSSSIFSSQRHSPSQPIYVIAGENAKSATKISSHPHIPPTKGPLKSRLSCDFMDTTILTSAQSPVTSNGNGGSSNLLNGHPSEETSGWSRFKLLLWKNWVVQKRHKIQTIVEVALPVFFASLLVIIRHLAPADVYHNATVYPAYRIGQLPNIPSTSLANMPLPTINLDNISAFEALSSPSSLISTFSLDPSMTFDPFGLLPPPRKTWPVAWAPNNTAVRRVMQKLARRLDLDIAGYGFATEQDMEEFVMKNYNAGMESKNAIDFLAGIIFTSNFLKEDAFPKDIHFKIRMKGTPRVINNDRSPWSPVETWMTDFQFPIFQLPGPRFKNRTEGGNPGYYKEGFLTLQDGVSRVLTELLSGKDTNDIEIEMRRLPYPTYADDKFLVALQGWLPLIIMLSFIYPALNIVKSIVHEKERRLKESMKMMGLPNWLHWTAWFVKSLAFILVTITLITLLLKSRWYGGGSLAVLEKADGVLFFFFLFVFALTSISFCFLMTVFFSKANSAATGAGIIWFVTYCPYFFLQLRYASLTRADKLISCLFSNTAMAYASQLMSMFEGTSEGIQWRNLNRGVSPDDDFTFGDVLVMLTIDAVIYLLLALYIEAVYPGEFGVPQPWYFPFTKSYWCGSSNEAQEITLVGAERTIDNAEFIEEEPIGLKAGVQIKGLTKEYHKGRMVVNHIHVNMYESQITALLGHNGAGKSTTMSMLTGLFPPTSGTALVNGYDIRTDIQGVRGSLGLCPQFDVLFDELTVEEHLDFFCKLKGYPSHLVRAETDRMVKALQLENKRKSMSSTLSGGMKRKLSVGIALCGESKVVMLDEPTSGMDPSARRSTWDLLQTEKVGRTILLTTHFMEEADLLGDRIAIMANGRIQCCGSSLFLKKKYGAGYHLVIVKETGCDAERITELIGKYIPEVTIHQNVGAELTYLLPSDKSHLFQHIFEELERNRKLLGISSYGASVTTMEEVFIRVGERASALHDVDRTNNNNGHSSKLDLNSSTQNLLQDAADCDLRNRGCRLFFQQLWSMLNKKFLYTVRNWLLFTSQLLIPVSFLAICLVVVQTLPGVENSQALTIKLENYLSTTTSVELTTPDNALARNLTEIYTDQFDLSGANKYERVDLRNQSMIDYYIEKSSKDLPGVNLHFLTGVTFKSIPSRRKHQDRVLITGWFNNQPYHVPPLTLNLIHNAMLVLRTGDSEYRLTVVNHPFPYDDFSKLNNDASSSSLGFQVGFNISFGMAFLAASFVIFLVKERVTKAKHLQFVSGVNFVTFWLANMFWDFVNFMVPCTGILLTFLIFNEEGFISFEQQGRFLLVFFLYGWAMLPLMYLLSFFFSIPATGFTRVTMFNIFTGMATLITVVILQIPELELLDLAQVLDWIFMALPNYSLGMAFNNLYTNARAVEYCTRPIVVFACKTGLRPNPCCKETGNCGSSSCIEFNKNPLGWEGLGIGRMISFMAIDGFVFVVLLVLFELRLWDKIKYLLCSAIPSLEFNIDAENGEVIPAEDDDVARERDLIQCKPLTVLQQDNNLIIKDLMKYYDHGFRAVDHLCLGVRRGECFGLLGINGAGKTTTFKMLTGDIDVSYGDAYLDGHSIRHNIKDVQRRLGYCPQFDATIEEMTGRETLRMFANLRGVPEHSIEAVVEDLTDKLLLRDHIDKQVKELSGGNKRKLSTAVALVGDPPIVFLDEPTTGMDPVARRQLWDTISRVRDNGQAIVLTSHSMEECEALCTRIAIMVNGQFKCLGSSQHLKNKFGQGYTLIAKVRGTSTVSSSSGSSVMPCLVASDAKMSSMLPDSTLHLHHSHHTPLAHTDSGRGGSIRFRSGSVKSNSSSGSVSPYYSIRSVPDMGPLMDFIQTNFPGAQLKDYHQGLVHYHLPEFGQTQSWARIFGLMESAKNKYQIEDYSVGQTTLEQVFLNFAKSQVGEDVNGRGRRGLLCSLLQSLYRPCVERCSCDYAFDFD
nr:ABCA3 protein [Diaphanosoma celebensis]